MGSLFAQLTTARTLGGFTLAAVFLLAVLLVTRAAADEIRGG